jgi:hypothetical protein
VRRWLLQDRPAGLIGQRIAAKSVTAVDDGTIPDRRGSSAAPATSPPMPDRSALMRAQPAAKQDSL